MYLLFITVITIENNANSCSLMKDLMSQSKHIHRGVYYDSVKMTHTHTQDDETTAAKVKVSKSPLQTEDVITFASRRQVKRNNVWSLCVIIKPHCQHIYLLSPLQSTKVVLHHVQTA